MQRQRQDFDFDNVNGKKKEHFGNHGIPALAADRPTCLNLLLGTMMIIT